MSLSVTVHYTETVCLWQFWGYILTYYNMEIHSLLGKWKVQDLDGLDTLKELTRDP